MGTPATFAVATSITVWGDASATGSSGMPASSAAAGTYQPLGSGLGGLGVLDMWTSGPAAAASSAPNGSGGSSEGTTVSNGLFAPMTAGSNAATGSNASQ